MGSIKTNYFMNESKSNVTNNKYVFKMAAIRHVTARLYLFLPICENHRKTVNISI